MIGIFAGGRRITEASSVRAYRNDTTRFIGDVCIVNEIGELSSILKQVKSLKGCMHYIGSVELGGCLCTLDLKVWQPCFTYLLFM